MQGRKLKPSQLDALEFVYENAISHYFPNIETLCDRFGKEACKLDNLGLIERDICGYTITENGVELLEMQRRGMDYSRLLSSSSKKPYKANGVISSKL
jgi:hypothetical protein